MPKIKIATCSCGNDIFQEEGVTSGSIKENACMCISCRKTLIEVFNACVQKVDLKKDSSKVIAEKACSFRSLIERMSRNTGFSIPQLKDVIVRHNNNCGIR